ncbi:alpha/beta fold hydrolase [Actinokineospora globicatena]|uniref:Alpha/beta hydrolase n=1 Tax=Actinokineospora globicatena TaxID=103729 RepID=A0A9W6QGY9_9PSEU|nr:alpha/beta hydrolase [Actinokineospora globicatena]GLW89580.1 alpha/beta hydrolase [Actinokineospora globicatena]
MNRAPEPILPLVVALHGTFGRGAVFDRLAADLRGRARVLAPDQRGHGRAARTPTYTRADFIADAVDFIRDLDEGPVILLGHSLGGINAYQLAARHPELVRALIIEDVGTTITAVLDVTDFPTEAPTRAALAAALIAKGIPDPTYFLQSAAPDPTGTWRFLFSWTDMMTVQHQALGDWWPDWLTSRCPALLLRGGRSPLLSAAEASRMATLRPNTTLVTFPDAAHWIHDDEPAALAAAVSAFLDGLVCPVWTTEQGETELL